MQAPIEAPGLIGDLTHRVQPDQEFMAGWTGARLHELGVGMHEISSDPNN